MLLRLYFVKFWAALSSKDLICSKRQWKHQNNLWNRFKVKNKHQKDDIDVVLVCLLLTLNIVHSLFWCVQCSFKQVNAGWVVILKNRGKKRSWKVIKTLYKKLIVFHQTSYGSVHENLWKVTVFSYTKTS